MKTSINFTYIGTIKQENSVYNDSLKEIRGFRKWIDENRKKDKNKWSWKNINFRKIK